MPKELTIKVRTRWRKHKPQGEPFRLHACYLCGVVALRGLSAEVSVNRGKWEPAGLYLCQSCAGALIEK